MYWRGQIEICGVAHRRVFGMAGHAVSLDGRVAILRSGGPFLDARSRSQQHRSETDQ